jgi:hypothetical protein
MANKRANQDAPAPRRTFSWIHLSDLHSTRDRRAFEQMNVLREMPADIERVIRDNGLRIDAIFFTGDASDAIYKGSRFAEKFAPATELLADIRQAAGAVSAERVFIVPGNHDIERDRIPNGLRLTWSSLLRQEEELKLLVETRRARRTREEAAQKLQECRAALKEVRQLVLEDTALEERWQDLVPAFAGYRNFLHDTGTAAHLMTNQPSKLQDRHFYCHRFEPQPDVTIEVVGFNSAWNCWNKSTHQKGQLHMGADWQLEYALNRLNRNTDDTVRLALLHHPPSWFWVTDTPLLEHQLPVDFDFCLHGHEHMSGQFLDLARSSARIAAGACYTHRDDMPGIEAYRYSVVEYDIDTRTVHIWPREFTRTAPKWRECDTDRYPENHISFRLQPREDDFPTRPLDRRRDEPNLEGLWKAELEFANNVKWDSCEINLVREGPYRYYGEGHGVADLDGKPREYRFELWGVRVQNQGRHLHGLWRNEGNFNHGVFEMRIDEDFELVGRFITSANPERGREKDLLDHGSWRWTSLQ